MDILVTRFIATHGTAILAKERRNELLQRLPEWLVDKAAGFDKDIRDRQLEEVALATENGAVYAKEYFEFGIFEALFQMSKELRCGLVTNIRDIPIKQETVEICEVLDANPYSMFSGYSTVIVAEDGLKIKRILDGANIPSNIVGYTTQNNDKIVVNGDESGFLQHIRKDELKNILGRKDYYERTNFVNS